MGKERAASCLLPATCVSKGGATGQRLFAITCWVRSAVEDFRLFLPVRQGGTELREDETQKLMATD
jgi:hypothetical protein